MLGVLQSLMVFGGAQAWASCGDTFEICGNRQDDDCDGSIDETCSTCYGFFLPQQNSYVFASWNELRADPDTRSLLLTSVDRRYGNYMDTRWWFLPSHRVVASRVRSLSYDIVAGDALYFGTYAISGNNPFVYWGS